MIKYLAINGMEICFSSTANLKCTPSDKKMYPWGYIYPRLGTPELDNVTRLDNAHAALTSWSLHSRLSRTQSLGRSYSQSSASFSWNKRSLPSLNRSIVGFQRQHKQNANVL